MFPAKRRKKYRQYLEPGANYAVPHSTKWSRQRVCDKEADVISKDNVNSAATIPSGRHQDVQSTSTSHCKDTIARSEEEEHHSMEDSTVSEEDVESVSPVMGCDVDNVDSMSEEGAENACSMSEVENSLKFKDCTLSNRSSSCTSPLSGSDDNYGQTPAAECEQDETASNRSLDSTADSHDLLNDQDDTDSSASDKDQDDTDSSASDRDQDDTDSSASDRDQDDTDSSASDREQGSTLPVEEVQNFDLNQLQVYSAEGDATKRKADKSQINYIEKYNLNEPLGAVDVTKTKYETLIMIFHLVLRHGMTGKLVEDLEKFVNELMGKDVIPVSKYLFNKIFEPSIVLKFQYFCEMYLGERQSFVDKTEKCRNCDVECNVHSLDGTNFFITLPLKPQLEDLAQKPGIEFRLNESKSGANICDLSDGLRFKEVYDKNDITLTMNSDGAAAFHTGSYSIWPIQAFVNNVEPSKRCLGENLILCALWFGKNSPNFPMFFDTFTAEMIDLSKEGIKVENCDGVITVRPVYVSKCTVDLVAKAKMQNSKQFNGKFVCSFCVHPGDTKVPGTKNNNALWPARQRYPLRSDASMRADMLSADDLDRAGQLRQSATTQDHVNGLKGLSALLPLPKFDICLGFVIDYMHCVGLGVVPKYINLIYECKGDCIVIGRSLQEVDARLRALTPPNTVLTAPRPLSARGDFKAKEFRALLLYYILPCMRGILKQEYFENLRKFVTAIHILLRDCILPVELEEADRLLQSFVKDFNKLFGDINMVHNIHLCTHLVMMVRMWGPLWAYSAFSFESGNGNLLKLNSGTRGVATLLALKYCMSRTVAHSMAKNEVGSDVLDFCSDVVSISCAKKCDDYGSARAHSEIAKKVNAEEAEALRMAGHEVSLLVYFNRVLCQGVWYYSRAYSKPKVFDDSCICLNDGTYAQIWKIIKLPDVNELYVLIRPIRIAVVPHLAPHIRTCSGDIMFASLKLIQLNDV